MSLIHARSSTRAHVKAFMSVAALALALVGATLSGSPAAAVSNCAVGGDVADGGTAGVGCSFGGAAGASIAGTVNVSDPDMTIAGSYGGYGGYPGVNVAADMDFNEPDIVLAGSVGGHFPYVADTYAGSYP